MIASRRGCRTDTSAANGPSGVGYGGWGRILRLVQEEPSASTGTLSPFFLGDRAHTGLDLTFLDKGNVISVEDAGDTLHTQRNALDPGYILPIDNKRAPPAPLSMATLPAAAGDDVGPTTPLTAILNAGASVAHHSHRFPARPVDIAQRESGS